MTETRIWLSSYPEGVPAEIDASQYDSLVSLMEESFSKFADRTAYSFMGHNIGYRETDVKSQALAAYFQSLGLEKGDRVAVMRRLGMQHLQGEDFDHPKVPDSHPQLKRHVLFRTSDDIRETQTRRHD